MAIRPVEKSFIPTTKEIKYLSKTFPQFRQNLIDFTKVYFPNTYNDFNESSPGMLAIELAAYVGDVLSFYIDSQFKENLIQYAEEEDNIISIAQSLGYRIKPATAAITDLDVYQLCPARGLATNYDPDVKYLLRLDIGAVFVSQQYNVNFRSVQVIDFADSTDREITVYAVDSNNKPLTYLVRKRIKVISGEIKTHTTSFGSPQKFSKVELPEDKVLEIIKVEDDNGNIWNQVDYLAQDVIFEDTVNLNYPSENSSSIAPMYLLKLKKTSRRFISRYNENFKAELWFGSGILNDTDSLINLEPKKIANSEYETNLGSTSLDPSDFLSSKSYGVAPSNVDLTITYSVGGGIESNVPSNSITTIKTVKVLNDINSFSPAERTLYNEVVSSLSVNNIFPATGGKDKDSVEEIRQNALAFFNAQNRLVTAEDYVVRSYSMPPKYGGVAKAFVVKDEQINSILRNNNSLAPTGGEFVEDRVGPNVVNLYLLGFNQHKKLVRINYDVKNNLKKYLDQYRILTDEIRILDAFVVNIGVEFSVSIFKNYNINEVLARSIDAVRKFFDIDRWQINQPIILNDLYMELAQVDGVQSVLSVTIFNRYRYKDGSDYEDYLYDIPSAIDKGVVYNSLDPMIWEIRYPEKDIIGTVVQ